MSKLMDTLALWCLGFGVDPKALDDEELKRCVENKDGHSSWEILYERSGYKEKISTPAARLEWDSLVTSGGKRFVPWTNGFK